MSILLEYPAFVRSKFKQDNQDHMISHALLGIINEWAEFGMLLNYGIPSFLGNDHIEELGDLLFYYTAYFDLLSVPIPEILINYEDNPKIALQVIDDISNGIKKNCVYETLSEEEVYAIVYSSYKFLISSYTTETLEKIIKANMAKLNKRYTQSFTSEESLERKDKCPVDSESSSTVPQV